MGSEVIRRMPEIPTGSCKMKNRRTEQANAFGVESPHELLGLPTHETDALRITEAASIRLATLRASTGSEPGVRDFVISQIIAAREAMLSLARQKYRPCETSIAPSVAIPRLYYSELN